MFHHCRLSRPCFIFASVKGPYATFGAPGWALIAFPVIIRERVIVRMSRRTMNHRGANVSSGSSPGIPVPSRDAPLVYVVPTKVILRTSPHGELIRRLLAGEMSGGAMFTIQGGLPCESATYVDRLLEVQGVAGTSDQLPELDLNSDLVVNFADNFQMNFLAWSRSLRSLANAVTQKRPVSVVLPHLRDLASHRDTIEGMAYVVLEMQLRQVPTTRLGSWQVIIDQLHLTASMLSVLLLPGTVYWLPAVHDFLKQIQGPSCDLGETKRKFIQKLLDAVGALELATDGRLTQFPAPPQPQRPHTPLVPRSFSCSLHESTDHRTEHCPRNRESAPGNLGTFNPRLPPPSFRVSHIPADPPSAAQVDRRPASIPPPPRPVSRRDLSQALDAARACVTPVSGGFGGNSSMQAQASAGGSAASYPSVGCQPIVRGNYSPSARANYPDQVLPPPGNNGGDSIGSCTNLPELIQQIKTAVLQEVRSSSVGGSSAPPADPLATMLPPKFDEQNHVMSRPYRDKIDGFARTAHFPKFSGKPGTIDWFTFWEEYRTHVHRQHPDQLSDDEKLKLLRGMTEGDAQNTVMQYIKQTSNAARYKEAVAALHVRYGKAERARAHVQKQIQKLKPNRSNVDSMHDFLDTMLGYREELLRAGMSDEASAAYVYDRIVLDVPSSAIRDFEAHVAQRNNGNRSIVLSMGAYDRLKQFIQWIKPLLESYLVQYADDLEKSPKKEPQVEEKPVEKVDTSTKPPVVPPNPYSFPPPDRYDREYSEFNANLQPPAAPPVQLVLPDGSSLALQGMMTNSYQPGPPSSQVAFMPLHSYLVGDAGGAKPADPAGGAITSRPPGPGYDTRRPNPNPRGGQPYQGQLRNYNSQQNNRNYGQPYYRNQGQGNYDQGRNYGQNSGRGQYNNTRFRGQPRFQPYQNRPQSGRPDWRNGNRNTPRERAKRCPFHDDDSHNSLDCPYSKKERMEILLRDGKCFNCGRRGHVSSQCRSISCRNCRLYGRKSRHHTAICELKPHPDLKTSGGTTHRPLNPDTEATQHNQRPKLAPEDDPEANTLRTIISVYARQDPEIRTSFSQTFWTTFDYEEDFMAERPEAEAEMSEETYQSYCAEFVLPDGEYEFSDHEGSPRYD